MNARFFQEQTNEGQYRIPVPETKSDQRFQNLLANLFITINDYLAFDNPEPAQPTLLNRFYKFMQWGKEGRVRARNYGSKLLELKYKTESNLVKKVVSDYLSEQGDLGSSTKLRDRIGKVLCQYFNITDGKIEKKQNNLITKSATGGPLGIPSVSSKEVAVYLLIKEEYEHYCQPKEMNTRQMDKGL
ncbi:MAG: hypothetical protein ACD_45C00217G0015 [uncultured bacterium]|nr:MAG: hypothetical protein ACD_45C00217G0015 [uncultured bacterium]